MSCNQCTKMVKKLPSSMERKKASLSRMKREKMKSLRRIASSLLSTSARRKRSKGS